MLCVRRPLNPKRRTPQSEHHRTTRREPKPQSLPRRHPRKDHRRPDIVGSLGGSSPNRSSRRREPDRTVDSAMFVGRTGKLRNSDDVEPGHRRVVRNTGCRRSPVSSERKVSVDGRSLQDPGPASSRGDHSGSVPGRARVDPGSRWGCGPVAGRAVRRTGTRVANRFPVLGPREPEQVEKSWTPTSVASRVRDRRCRPATRGRRQYIGGRADRRRGRHNERCAEAPRPRR